MNLGARPNHNQVGSVIVTVLLVVALVSSLGFGMWAFSDAQSAKSDVDTQIANATAAAVKEAEDAKDAEFAEEEKNPFKRYIGSETYGTLSFDFPKSWSVYEVDNTSNAILNFYAHPNSIPGLENDVNFAFRVQILDSPYESEAGRLQSAADNGSVAVEPFRAENVPSELGIFATGEVVNNKQGAMVILPQRDKTFRLWTESETFVADFQNIIATIDFVP